MLDGAARIDDIVNSAVKDGQPAIGITDHGNMYGVLPLYKAAKKAGVNPVLGCELYMAFKDRKERYNIKTKTSDLDGEVEGQRKAYYHLTTLAENNVGYKNLIQLSSRAFLEGYYRKPRVDWELLDEHSEGIIATTGCLGGHVLQELLDPRRNTRENYAAAKKKAARLQDIFGKDNLFIELQDHGIADQIKTNPSLIRIAKELNAPLLATNDSHYTHKEDAAAHDALICQPPGTKVIKVLGTNQKGNPKGFSHTIITETINIEDVKVGDKLVSWNGDSRRGSIRRSGSSVSKVGNRQFKGDLVKITTPSGKSSSYTPNHICVARLDVDLTDGNYITYIMRKDNKFRIGSTQFHRRRSNQRPESKQLGLLLRAKEQLADAIWALSVHETKNEALEEEQWISYNFGIPTWSFPETRSTTSAPRTPIYSSLWNKVGDLTIEADECLSHYGRSLEHPFWKPSDPKGYLKKYSFINACNLMNGMLVCEPKSGTTVTYDGTGVWQPITISKVPYSGTVYSLDIENDQTYVADGIVTHNCVQTGSRIADEKRFRFEGTEHYLKTAQEMRHLFREQPSACDNTLWIAERANIDIPFGTTVLPDFPLPEGYETDDDYLRHLALEGAKNRWDVTDAILDRINFELQTISNLGLSSYFLIVWDLIRHAGEAGIRIGPGRGSAAGSAVCYAVGITKIDPIKYDLVFERFLNPDRVSMADIDIDMDSRCRDQMIAYAAEKYGRDHVAQIVTFSTIKARAAVADAARVLDYEYQLGRDIVKAMPRPRMGVSTPIRACLEYDPTFPEGFAQAGEFRRLYDVNPDIHKVVNIAMGLEDMRRQDGIHAAAVVISKGPLTDYLPIQRKQKPDENPLEAPVVTQYEMGGVDDLGLLKMDFLGLRNLDVISDTLALIKETKGIDVDIDTVPLDDPNVFKMLQRGHGIGVFQLEGRHMRDLMKSLNPTRFEDLAALVALYRPGPMAANMHNDYANRKNGRQEISYLHPELKEILDPTYGLMIYQETLMRVAQEIAGFTLAEADILRKACGKKIRSLILEQRKAFVAGCVAQGHDAKVGNDIFDVIEPFADYAFSSSHAFSYGLIAYQTAYLKANFPVEYLSCLLTSVKDKPEKIVVYLNECRLLEIPVLIPDINNSQVDFAPVGDTITFGLSAIKGVGENVTGLIVEERALNGPFKDFHDFCERVPTNVLNKKAIISLVTAGVFDSLGHARKGLLGSWENIVKTVKTRRKNTDSGVFSLFELDEEKTVIPDEHFSKEEILKIEREILGLFVSDHPLANVTHLLDQSTDATIGELQDLEDGTVATVGGIVTDISHKITKKGDAMAIFTLQDLASAIEVVVFPNLMDDVADALVEDDIILLKCRVDQSEESPKFFAMEATKFIDHSDKPVRLKVSDDIDIDLLKASILDCPGPNRILLHTSSGVLRLPDEWSVNAASFVERFRA